MAGDGPRDRVHDRGHQALWRRKGRLHQGGQGRAAHLPLAGGVAEPSPPRPGWTKITGRESTRVGRSSSTSPSLDQYQEMLKQHPELASVTFCWMQGERDANGGADAAYKAALQQVDRQPAPRPEAPGHEHRHWPHRGLCARPPLMRRGADRPNATSSMRMRTAPGSTWMISTIEKSRE